MSMLMYVFVFYHSQQFELMYSKSLYTDSPVDSSLFSLYIHQNYTQFCNESEECDGVIDWLSWVDSSGGEMASALRPIFMILDL